MKHVYSLILLLLVLPACHTVDEPADSPDSNFEALWKILDEHYCFFADKNIDWNAVHDRYAPKISDEMTREELFDVCAAMLDELRDGHTNLSSAFNTSYYREWWSAYHQNYS
ncbi:MAG: peptidase S41, partial [Duncaniella sp.]|nr:peptidase S41 [Duncaniella sp.]